jgi:hypothetical protein
MKMSKPTKSTEQYKILRMLSRNDQFERNGGGQFVSMNRAYKDKSKYNRNEKKKELRNNLNSYFFIYARFKLPFLCNGLESACLEYFSTS